MNTVSVSQTKIETDEDGKQDKYNDQDLQAGKDQDKGKKDKIMIDELQTVSELGVVGVQRSLYLSLFDA